MDKHENDRSKESDQTKQLHNIARLVDDHDELKKRYMMVLSEEAICQPKEEVNKR